jgi:flagellin
MPLEGIWLRPKKVKVAAQAPPAAAVHACEALYPEAARLLMPTFQANPLSGFRLTSARDDAASLAIANALEAQRRSSVAASRNIGDAVGMIQTASGALESVTDIVSRMRELATQSSNGALNDGDRQSIQAEFQALQEEAARIQGTTTFNGKSVLRDPAPGGTPADPASLRETMQVGEGSGDTQSVDFSGPNLSKLASSNVSTAGGARAALDALDETMKSVSERQSYFGATLNGFDSALSNAETGRLSSASAESRLRDADVAEEASNFSSAQIMNEAKVAILAQGIKASEYVLSLLKT